MIKPIVTDETFLSQKSGKCRRKDLPIAQDLLDTIKAYEYKCVGMAANMIGYSKRMIVIQTQFMHVVMINPIILSKKDPYTTMEGCLSLSGEREAVRYREIEVEYLDTEFKKHHQFFYDTEAQIIQHEMDHLEGILI